uniref:Small ribosomal subunit protein bS16c n=1 Tax=Helminthora furcellata TaxID=1884666 RepID=A0A1G4NZJ4_9FLOR|nr:Ribosomal protein S16 [Helminthora furcellata]SCW21240.1 Ribosomal protein S16 [Helminthora furcellata]SCW24100.1 Ribosomal protein S16 [Helminthora furcellata]
MLKIRLKKYGRKKRPSYRIVVIDSRKRRDGRPIEELGFYDPITNQITLDIESVNTYKNHGAQTSKVVESIYLKAIQIQA